MIPTEATFLERLAEKLDISEREAAELWELRETIGRLIAAKRALRVLCSRRVLKHASAISSSEKRSTQYLAYLRGRAQEARDLPVILHEFLAGILDIHKEHEEARS